jgi:CheY-like chemotaxis protein
MRESSFIGLHLFSAWSLLILKPVDGSMPTSSSSPTASSGAHDPRVGKSSEMSPHARRREAAPWVLIVDDDPLAARATARLVMGVTRLNVALVADVDRALQMVTRAPDAPIAVVLDYDLSGGENGLSVLLSLRASGIEVPCAFHTGAPQRARAALTKSRLSEGYPVFDKGTAGAEELVRWLAERAPSVVPDNPHRSGIRSKLA